MSVSVSGASNSTFVASGGGSLSTSVPSGTTTTDIVYAIVGSDPSKTLSPPGAFTKLGSTVSTGSGLDGSLYRRVVQSGDPTSYNWQVSGSNPLFVSYVRVSGGDTGTPEDVSVQGASVYGNNLVMPAITTYAPDDLILYMLTGYESSGGSITGSGLTVDTQDSAQHSFALHQTTNVSGTGNPINHTLTNGYTNAISAFAIAVRNSGAQPVVTPPTVTVSVEPYCKFQDTVTVTASAAAASGTIDSSIGYAWTFAAKPVGSTAVFSSQGSATTSFVADADGTFTPQCIVTASDSSSSPATASVIANAAIHVVINGQLKPATINAIIH